MEFVIVTGLSGAGKVSALHALEDIGFYCVDNIPSILVSTFYDLCKKAVDPKMQRVAVGIDIRGDQTFADIFNTLNKIGSENKYKILFIDARDDIIVRRFKENRRKHPLVEKCNGSVKKAISVEREKLKLMRDKSDYIIDTSFLLPAQLKERLSSLFLDQNSNALIITCMSFGFKYGIPTEADLVFDVRCLPNPFYVEELKNLTGLDSAVKDYVMKWDQTKGVISRLFSLINFMIPLYCEEGKSQLVIAIGCTGGKHRSVTLTQKLCEHLLESGSKASSIHRDILRDKKEVFASKY